MGADRRHTAHELAGIEHRGRLAGRAAELESPEGEGAGAGRTAEAAVDGARGGEGVLEALLRQLGMEAGLTLSLLAAIDARVGGALWHHLALLPEAVWRGQLWRLFTWPFVHGGPLALLFACVTIYAFGSDLLLTWGARRYLRYLAIALLVAGVGTSVLALALPGARYLPHLAGMALGDALVIAWARQFPDHPVWVYFVLLLRGPALVSLVVAVTLVFAVYAGVDWMMPELLAVGAALFLTSRSRRRWWLDIKLRWLRRRLRSV
jgi:membrane associated rhomboid family serine protease